MRVIFSRFMWLLLCSILSSCFGTYSTYTNHDHNFSIKYPNSWAIKENTDGVVVGFISPMDTSVDQFLENITVVVQDMSANPMSLEKYNETVIAQMQSVFNNVTILESTSTYLDGTVGTKFVFTAAAQTTIKMMVVWMIRNSRAYQITLTSEADAFDRIFPHMQTALDSFDVQ
jgi:hypothetical protein